MDQPGAPDQPIDDTVDATVADGSPPPTRTAQAVPLRDSALGALGIAAPVLRRPAFLWAPTILGVLVTLPSVLVIPEAFFTGPMFGQQMTQAEARAFFTLLQEQMGPFVLLSVIETLVLLPFVTVVTYRLASAFLDGRPAEPFGADLLGSGARMLGSTLVLAAVFAGFLVAGSLIFALLVASGAGIFLLLLMPILIAFALIVFLRLLPVPPLIVQGEGPVQAVQHAWSMSEGHVLRILRWGLVIWLASFAGGIAGQAVTQLAALALPLRVAYLLASVVQGPVLVVSAIILTLLVRLLQHGPSEAAPARAIGPDWGAPPPPPV